MRRECRRAGPVTVGNGFRTDGERLPYRWGTASVAVGNGSRSGGESQADIAIFHNFLPFGARNKFTGAHSLLFPRIRQNKGKQPMSRSRVEAVNPPANEGRPIVASVNETMAALKIGRAKTYELINSGQLQSYVEGTSRKITWSSIHDYVERRLAEEAKRRDGRAA